MGETTKTLSLLVLAIAFVAAAVSWVLEDPGTITWTIRIVGPSLALLALGLLLYLQLRKDRVPDYLKTVHQHYFNRNGFCFAFNVGKVEGHCVLYAYFQNQFDRPCVGRIAGCHAHACRGHGWL